MSLILQYEYISQKLSKICLNPVNNFKELWLLTTHGLKILQALVTQRIVHIGTCQLFFDGPNNTFIKRRNTRLQNLPASVAVIWLMEVVKSLYFIMYYRYLNSVLYYLLCANQRWLKFKSLYLFRKTYIWLQDCILKKQWHFYTFGIFKHELQTSDQSVQLPATDYLIPVTVITTILFTLHLIRLWSLSRLVRKAY